MGIPLEILERLNYGKEIAVEVAAAEPNMRAFVLVIPQVPDRREHPDAYFYEGENRLRRRLCDPSLITGYEIRWLKHNAKYTNKAWGGDYDAVLADKMTRAKRLFIGRKEDIGEAISPWLTDMSFLSIHLIATAVSSAIGSRATWIARKNCRIFGRKSDMASLPQRRYTPEQYLEMDRKAEHRSEYVNGEILAMAGASREHNLIVTNLVREVSLALRGRPCETYSNDMRVEISSARYAYPDVVVACGPPQFGDSALDILLNPTVIMEVLSPTTAADDRSWKFAHYRRLASLTDYVMLSQYQPFVEHYARRDAQWVLTEITGLEAVLRLTSIGVELPLSAIYERVEFAPDLEMPAL